MVPRAADTPKQEDFKGIYTLDDFLNRTGNYKPVCYPPRLLPGFMKLGFESHAGELEGNGCLIFAERDFRIVRGSAERRQKWWFRTFRRGADMGFMTRASHNDVTGMAWADGRLEPKPKPWGLGFRVQG